MDFVKFSLQEEHRTKRLPFAESSSFFLLLLLLFPPNLRTLLTVQGFPFPQGWALGISLPHIGHTPSAILRSWIFF